MHSKSILQTFFFFFSKKIRPLSELTDWTGRKKILRHVYGRLNCQISFLVGNDSNSLEESSTVEYSELALTTEIALCINND